MNGGKRTLIWVIVAAVVLGAAATAVVLITRSGDEPDQAAAQRTQEFLKGEGAPLLTMHSTAQTVANEVSDCANTVARLDKDAPPDQVVLLMGSLEDEALQDAFAEEHQQLGETLTDCRKTPGLDEAVRKVQTRLDELGVRR